MNHRPATCFYVTPLNCPRVFSFGMPCIVRNSRFHNRSENQRNSVRFVVRFLARFLPILGTFTHLRPRYFHALFFAEWQTLPEKLSFQSSRVSGRILAKTELLPAGFFTLLQVRT